VFFNSKLGIQIEEVPISIWCQDLVPGKICIIRVNFRVDKEITRGINWEADYPFRGKIKNEDMIGKSTQDYINRCNTEHPDDPVK
jgi:hypothetical protein